MRYLIFHRSVMWPERIMNKLILVVCFFVSVNSFAKENANEKLVLPKINKTPKSLYLLKKASVDSDVGEPLIYPNEQQMRMLYYDVYYKRDRLPLEDAEKFN